MRESGRQAIALNFLLRPLGALLWLKNSERSSTPTPRSTSHALREPGDITGSARAFGSLVTAGLTPQSAAEIVGLDDVDFFKRFVHDGEQRHQPSDRSGQTPIQGGWIASAKSSGENRPVSEMSEDDEPTSIRTWTRSSKTGSALDRSTTSTDRADDTVLTILDPVAIS